MSGIQSSVGLISGIDYTSLVNELIELDAIPRKNLLQRTEILKNEEKALTNMTTLFLTSSYLIGNLNKADTWNQCDVASSNETLLKATKSGSPTPGVYTFTPIRTAMAQQTVVKGVSSDTTALGKSGTVTIGKGWSLEKDIDLQDINGGDGFTKGHIRVTDGSGTRATIDLRNCFTVNDVLDAINNNHNVDVYAELDGDRIKLTDMSGGDPEKFKVQDVSGGKTAASLGLADLESDEDGVITGSSIYRLGENLSLSVLNDGNGVVFDSIYEDLSFTCSDGSKVNVDFNYLATSEELEKGEGRAKELTVGDLLDTINTAEGNNGKIVATISSDGKSIVFTDNTVPYIKATAIEGETPEVEEGEEAPEPEITYELPDGYDAENYEVDEEGYVIHKTGENQGQRVVDGNPPKTKISQPAIYSPVMQTLGIVDKWDRNSNEPVEFTGSFATRSLLGSMESPLLSSLNGGQGFAYSTAGEIEVQDRAGNKATLDFTDEELRIMNSATLNEVVAYLNYRLATTDVVDKDGNEVAGHGVGIEIELNDTKTGLKLSDKTGATTHNMVFKDKVTTETVPGEPAEDEDGEDGEDTTITNDPKIASALGLNIDASRTNIDGSNLKLQTVSYTTKLSDLNGGKGVTLAGGQIRMTDSSGKTDTLIIDPKKHQTLGDIINGINGLNGVNVVARINSDGDGIELVDFANGDGTFSCYDPSSSSKICKDLKIDKTVSQEQKAENGGQMIINGSTSFSFEVEETDTLDDIRKKINELGGNFNATIITDGSSAPYRLVITGGSTGAAGAMNIDLSCLGLSTSNMTEAQDALLAYGDASSDGAVVLSSSTNIFKNVVNGIDLTVQGTSTSPITITSEKSNVIIKASLTTFVENYNKFREDFNAQTKYDTEENVRYILNGNAVAMAFERDVTNVLLKQVHGINGVNSLQSIGISIGKNIDAEGNALPMSTSTGKLSFDEKVFDALWESNPEAMQEFFFKEREVVDPNGELDEDGNVKTTKVKTGWAQQFMDVAESLTGTSSGKVYHALQTLDTKINQNTERADYMQARLDVKKQQMLNKFYQMEQAMAKMSTDMSTVSSIASNWAQNLGNTGLTG